MGVYVFEEFDWEGEGEAVTIQEDASGREVKGRTACYLVVCVCA